ncbi:hypothetical protein [Sphingobacterium sp. HMA12]|uniref:hypothetical protein n=1 Tax=Sphingobacterium sp. HMA12 TaxID=2050894 RepID=UPI000CE9B25C|nr:hypothetical protein [Sphingobacterium sp. HMA12]
MEKDNNDGKRISNKARVQCAISDIMRGYLFLHEAVEKYEVPASTIILHLKKIQREKQKEKKDPLPINNSKTVAKENTDSRKKDDK